MDLGLRDKAFVIIGGSAGMGLAARQVLAAGFGCDAALGRPGQPDEVGTLIAFLLSQRCGFLTGQTIGIDGSAP